MTTGFVASRDQSSDAPRAVGGAGLRKDRRERIGRQEMMTAAAERVHMLEEPRAGNVSATTNRRIMRRIMPDSPRLAPLVVRNALLDAGLVSNVREAASLTASHDSA